MITYHCVLCDIVIIRIIFCHKEEIIPDSCSVQNLLRRLNTGGIGAVCDYKLHLSRTVGSKLQLLRYNPDYSVGEG